MSNASNRNGRILQAGPSDRVPDKPFHSHVDLGKEIEKELIKTTHSRYKWILAPSPPRLVSLEQKCTASLQFKGTFGWTTPLGDKSQDEMRDATPWKSLVLPMAGLLSPWRETKNFHNLQPFQARPNLTIIFSAPAPLQAGYARYGGWRDHV